MRYRKIFNTLFDPNSSLPSLAKNIETYVIVDGKQAGPFSNSELKILIKKGSLMETTMVWSQGYANWIQAQYMPHVNKLLLLCSHKKSETEKTKVVALEQNLLYNDLLAALIQLGYSKKEAKAVAEDILKSNPQISLSEAIKTALKKNH